MTRLTVKQALLARTCAQGLAGDGAPGVAEAVRRVVGLQAQDVRANRLGAWVRTSGLTKFDVDGAVAAGEVVRTWGMRGTLHMVTAEDVGWIVGLLGPHFARRLAGRRRQLGLDEETCERGVAALEAVLGGAEPLSRNELVARIAEHGVVLDPRSQAPAHLLGYAAMTGTVCRGPELDGDEPSYVLLREWVGERARLTEEEGLARLARRYVAGYGPASAEDFAAWSGLPLGPARAGFAAIREDLEPITVAGERAFTLAGVDPPPEGPVVRLLGHFDAYLLGYRGREPAVPAEFDRRIQSGGGFIMPAVLVDGRVLGTWRHTRAKGRLRVTIEPFTTIPKRLWPALQKEIDDLGRFLDMSAEWDFPT